MRRDRGRQGAQRTAFDAIVMGASWGGLHAYRTILSTLPASFPLPVLIVQHQHVSADDRMARLLDQYCPMPVVSPEDKQRIRPGHIYVASPGLHMLVEEDLTVSFSAGPAVHFSRPAIDELFFSAAVAYGSRLLGVILTGANGDGSAGMAYIRRRGGYTVAQSPLSAEAPVMPQAAITTGSVSRVLDLEEIGPYLAETVIG